MRVIIKPDYETCATWAANYIVYKIQSFRPAPNKPFVLGLPTGSTPLGVYQKLIELHQQGKISFENVVTFNMDEYIGLPADHDQSYSCFMHKNFFDHIDIKPENINLLNGMTTDYAKECQNYEDKIKRYGGINLFLGGVGEDGHIAFNEPFSSLSSRTRVKTLTEDTIKANSRFFDNDTSKVPTTALTVGLATIMDAQEVLILATGPKKAKAIHHAIEGSINHMWTISVLQIHKHTIMLVDTEAAKDLNKDTIAYFNDIEKNNY